MMYSERNIIMFASFNGYILRESATSETPQVKTFTIDIYKDSGNNKFFRDGARDTRFNMFKCSHLNNYICDKILDSDEANRVKLLRVNVNKEKIKEDFNENDIKNEFKGTLMEDHKLFKGYFEDELARADSGEDDESVENIHIITIVPTSTAGPFQQGVPQEEPLTIERIIETGRTIGNKDKPVITMYKYVERTHVQEFIRNRIEINLLAFEIGSSRQNDYQGISISGGSGTGKTRHGFETINIIKDLKQIKNGSFEVIHIFVQICPESSLVRFDKRPPRDQSTGRYPRDPSHVNNVGSYLALAIASYYFTKNYQQESLQYFKELAKSSAFDLVTVLQAIRNTKPQQKLLILLQLDEYQRDEYLIANILRYTSQLVANKQVCNLGVLIVPICTGTAPIKLQEFDNPGHLSVTDYCVYDIHMSPMDIKGSLNFMDSVINHRMQDSNRSISPILRENSLYLILIGAVKGIAVIMERCALELLKMKSPLGSAEQAREIWKILVEWAKKRYSLTNWLDSIGGRKDPQDNEDEKRKRAILKLMFWIHTQKLITKDTVLDDSTVGDHEAGGLIFLEKIDNTQYKAKAPLVLIASLASHLELGFFDDIILDPFTRLDEESFPKFILHMHLITYRLADLVGIRQMTIEEIYFGCLLASNEVLSKKIDIQHNVNYRSAPILLKKDDDDLKKPYTWNKLIDRKSVPVIADANNDKVENVDVTTGHFIVLVRRRSKSSDSLTPHAEEQYKFSSATESGLPVHKTFTLEEFEKELKKATKGYECFIVITVKSFLDEVNKLPSRTGIVSRVQFLKFMGIYGDFTRFIEGVSEKTTDEREEVEVSEMMIDDEEEESEMIVDN